MKFVWKIPMTATPEQVWRYVADTNRVNQYAGLPEFTFRFIPDPEGGSHQVGETRYMGWKLSWDEHPFEWVEGQRFEVIRAYRNGPVKTLRTEVVLRHSDGGSVIEQTLTCEPRWAIAIPALYMELAVTTKRRFVAAYRKIDRFLEGAADTPLEPVPRQAISPGRAAAFRDRLASVKGGDLISRLLDDIERLPDEELDRMRPFVFADRWNADRRLVLALFLHAAQAGLLDLSWDVICPSCRGTPERHSSLRHLRRQAHCPACNIKYDADFAESVEVAFKPNPVIRRIEVHRYCSGGPMNAPHVVAQQQVPGGASRTIEMTLSPWKYHVRSLKLQAETFIQIRREIDRGDAVIRMHRPTLDPQTLELGAQVSLTFQNQDDKPITVMVERIAGNEQAATAAMVIAMQEFRTLFASEILSPEMPVSVGAVTLLFTDLKASTELYEQVGEAPAYGLVQRHFDLLRECIARCEGGLVKTIGDAVMAVFTDPAHAVHAAFEMHRAIREDNARRGEPCLYLKIGMHHGPCFAVTLNEILDYFGTAVNVAARVQRESEGDDLVITEEIWADGDVQEVLRRYPHQHKELEVHLKGISGARRLHWIRPELKG